MPKGWVRSLRLVEHLLHWKVGSHCCQVALLVVVRGVRKFEVRKGREAGGLFGGVRRRRALLVVIVAVVGFRVFFWKKTLMM
jgi:hypothetical protein